LRVRARAGHDLVNPAKSELRVPAFTLYRRTEAGVLAALEMGDSGQLRIPAQRGGRVHAAGDEARAVTVAAAIDLAALA